jgi:hypothetical protein
MNKGGMQAVVERKKGRKRKKKKIGINSSTKKGGNLEMKERDGKKQRIQKIGKETKKYE